MSVSEPKRKMRRDGRLMPVGRPFKKGESGNPLGPALHKPPFDVEKHARQYSKEMTEILVGIARHEKVNASVRVTAAETVLNRAHGRPRQAMDVSGEINFGVSFNQFVRQLITGNAVETIEADGAADPPQLLRGNGHDHDRA